MAVMLHSAVGASKEIRAANLVGSISDPSKFMVGQYVVFLGEIVSRITQKGAWDGRFKSYGLYSSLNRRVISDKEIEAYSLNIGWAEREIMRATASMYESLWTLKWEWIQQIANDPLNADLRNRANLDLMLHKYEVEDRQGWDRDDYLDAVLEERAWQEVEELGKQARADWEERGRQACSLYQEEEQGWRELSQEVAQLIKAEQARRAAEFEAKVAPIKMELQKHRSSAASYAASKAAMSGKIAQAIAKAERERASDRLNNEFLPWCLVNLDHIFKRAKRLLELSQSGNFAEEYRKVYGEHPVALGLFDPYWSGCSPHQYAKDISNVMGPGVAEFLLSISALFPDLYDFSDKHGRSKGAAQILVVSAALSLAKKAGFEFQVK